MSGLEGNSNSAYGESQWFPSQRGNCFFFFFGQLDGGHPLTFHWNNALLPPEDIDFVALPFRRLGGRQFYPHVTSHVTSK